MLDEKLEYKEALLKAKKFLMNSTEEQINYYLEREKSDELIK